MVRPKWLILYMSISSILTSLSSQMRRVFSHKIGYILCLFLVTRLVLTGVGLVNRMMVKSANPSFSFSHFSPYGALNMWGEWDSGWYLGIAQHGYSARVQTGNMAGQTSLAFFPLYPIAMKWLGKIIGSVYLAGLIISNVCLLVSCYLLYKIALESFGEKIARKAVKYLLIFPVTFIFSGVFTESLFLMLMLACFTFAKRRQWWLAGLFGGLLALTRSLGVIIILPLLYEYLKQRQFRLRQINASVLWLFLIPVGLGIFSFYNYRLTGDWLAFMHAQAAWGRSLREPLRVIVGAILHPDIRQKFLGYFTLIFSGVLFLGYKKVEKSYWWYGLGLLLIPLVTGIASMPRFMLPIFPLYIILARWSENEDVDMILTIVCTITLGFLMGVWSLGYDLVI